MAERESRAVYWIAGALIVALVAFFFARDVENPLEPEPKAAYVALQAAGTAAAIDGTIRLGDRSPFRLFAVLEATDWRGRTVYFTEAPALLLGGRRIDAAAVRPWSGGRVARMRWFTLDAFSPYLAVESAADLDRFRLVETFRPEWGEGWSVETVVDPKVVPLDPALGLRPLGFGSERYAVRIELFDDERALTPSARAQSPGADAAVDGRATRASAALPPPLERLSLAFGRAEIAPAAALPPALAERIAALEARGAVFERARLLADHLAAAGAAAAGLDWRAVDLAARPPAWGSELGDLGAGDLVQAGARVAVLYRDQGEPGRLDDADLAIDLFKGMSIRRLDQIFRGEAGLELETAQLARTATAPAEPAAHGEHSPTH